MSAEGEEWKGEPEEPHLGIFGALWGVPKPMTSEEKAAEAQRRAEALARAEILFVALPEFDRARPCPKCRNPKEAKTRYCVTGIAQGYSYAGGCKGETGTHEHFHRTCRLCKYDWLERCLGEE